MEIQAMRAKIRRENIDDKINENNQLHKIIAR